VVIINPVHQSVQIVLHFFCAISCQPDTIKLQLQQRYFYFTKHDINIIRKVKDVQHLVITFNCPRFAKPVDYSITIDQNGYNLIGTWRIALPYNSTIYSERGVFDLSLFTASIDKSLILDWFILFEDFQFKEPSLKSILGSDKIWSDLFSSLYQVWEKRRRLQTKEGSKWFDWVTTNLFSLDMTKSHPIFCTAFLGLIDSYRINSVCNNNLSDMLKWLKDKSELYGSKFPNIFLTNYERGYASVFLLNYNGSKSSIDLTWMEKLVRKINYEVILNELIQKDLLKRKFLTNCIVDEYKSIIEKNIWSQNLIYALPIVHFAAPDSECLNILWRNLIPQSDKFTRDSMEEIMLPLIDNNLEVIANVYHELLCLKDNKNNNIIKSNNSNTKELFMLWIRTTFINKLKNQIITIDHLSTMSLTDIKHYFIDEIIVLEFARYLFKNPQLFPKILLYLFKSEFQSYLTQQSCHDVCCEWLNRMLLLPYEENKLVVSVDLMTQVFHLTTSKAESFVDPVRFHTRLIRTFFEWCSEQISRSVWLSSARDLYEALSSVNDLIVNEVLDKMKKKLVENNHADITSKSITNVLQMLRNLQTDDGKINNKFATNIMIFFLELLSTKFPLQDKMESLILWAPVLSEVFQAKSLSNAVVDKVNKLNLLKEYIYDEIFIPIIINKSITIENFINLQRLGGSLWVENLALLYHITNYDEDVGDVKALLNKIHNQIILMRERIKYLRCALEDFSRAKSPHTELDDKQLTLQTIENKIDSFTLLDIDSNSIWEEFGDILVTATDFFMVRKSIVFNKILTKTFDEELLIEADISFTDYFENTVASTIAVLQNFLHNVNQMENCDALTIVEYWCDNYIDVDEERNILKDTSLNEESICLIERKNELNAIRDYHEVKLLIFELGHVKKILQREDLNEQMEEFEILSNFSKKLELNGDKNSIHISSSTTTTALSLANSIIEWKNIITPYLRNQKYSDIRDLMHILASSDYLIDFIKQIKDETNLNLIDMIEEHADGYINADTITNFESVRRFLTATLAIDKKKHIFHWLTDFVTISIEKSSNNISQLCAKVYACNLQANALHDMWYSVAHREESTKLVIEKYLSNGIVYWCRSNTSPFMLVLCLNDGSFSEKKDRSFLEEIRSRALLLVNSTPKSHDDPLRQTDERSRSNMREFIYLANIVLGITSTLNTLIDYGHFELNISLLDCNFSHNELVNMKANYEDKLIHWKECLMMCRMRYHCINFLFSTQLWVMYDYLRGCTASINEEIQQVTAEMLEFLEIEYLISDEMMKAGICHKQAKSLLGFMFDHICPNANVEIIWRDMEASKKNELVEIADNYIDALNIVAAALEKICIGGGYAVTTIVEDINVNKISIIQVEYCLYESDSQVIPLLFGIYPHGNVSRAQILSCEDGMTFEEFIIFMLRAFSSQSSSLQEEAKTYVILNFHLLGHSSRTALFESILYLRAIDDNVRRRAYHNNLVMFIRRDSDAERIVIGSRLFNSSHYTPLDDVRIKKLFVQRAPRVTVVIGGVAGIGKTRSCFQQAYQKRKHVVRILVSDQCSRKEFAKLLDSISLSSELCLHLDIVSPSQINEIEYAIFELFYLGVSQIGTQVVHWNVGSECFIEEATAVATINDVFKGKGVDCLRFFPKTLVFGGHINLQVDNNIASDIQIVCNYLLGLKNDTLHTYDLTYPCPEAFHDIPVTMISIPALECQTLLNEYFFSKFDIDMIPSMNVFQVFLKVLAHQLRSFSTSGQYLIETFNWTGNDPRNRTHTIRHLVDVIRTFATRSVVHVRNRQCNNTITTLTNDNLEDENLGILRWEDDNQLMISTSGGILTLLYKRLTDIPKHFYDWIVDQTPGNQPPTDYFKLNSYQLREILSNFCGLATTFTGVYLFL
jgi:hypothetical protein